MADVAQAFVEMLRKSPDLPDHVRQGVLAGGDASVEPLVALLRDRSTDTPDHPSQGQARVHAAVLLGHLRDARAVEPLLEALVQDRSRPRLVRAHAGALARIGDVVEPTLARAAATDVFADRLVFAMVLASAGVRDDRIADLLRDLLPHDPALVLPLVGRYGDPALARDVAQVLLGAGVSQPRVTRLAVDALAELGVQHAKLDALHDKAQQKSALDELGQMIEVARTLLDDVLPEA